MIVVLVVIGLIGVLLLSDVGQEAVLTSSDSIFEMVIVLLSAVLFSAVSQIILISLARKRWHLWVGGAANSIFLLALAVAAYRTNIPRVYPLGVACLVFAAVPWLWFPRVRPYMKIAIAWQRYRTWVLSISIALFILFAFLAPSIGRLLGSVASVLAIGTLILSVAACIASLRSRKYIVWALVVSVATGLVFYRDRPIRQLSDPGLFSARAAVDCPEAVPAGMMLVEDVFNCWFAANKDENGQATMFLVETAGGGVRAAEWTAMVLFELDRQIPDFSNRLFAISSVSGGSLGSAIYLGELVERSRRDDCRPPESGGFSPCARKMLDGEFLGPVVASALSSDLIRTVFRPAGAVLDDRGTALERAFERSWENAYGSDLFGSSLSALWPKRPWPALIMNTTLSARGQIAIMSNLNNLESKEGIFSLGMPTDRVSTAVVNSARFPGISPGARLTLAWREEANGDAFLVPPNEVPSYSGKLEHRYFDTLVDGGYADNYGASSLLALMEQLDEIQCDQIRQQAESKGENLYKHSCSRVLDARRFVRYVLIQITSDPGLPGKCTAPPSISQGINILVPEASGFFSPVATLMNTRSLTGIDRSNRLFDRFERLYSGDLQSRSLGQMKHGERFASHTYFHFGLGPLDELPPPLDEQEKTFAYLKSIIERRQRGDPEEQIQKDDSEETQRQLKEMADRSIREPTFEGRVPPLTWGIAAESKEAIANHFQLCGPWAVFHLQEITKLGLYYPRPGLWTPTLGTSPAVKN